MTKKTKMPDEIYVHHCWYGSFEDKTTPYIRKDIHKASLTINDELLEALVRLWEDPGGDGVEKQVRKAIDRAKAAREQK